MPMTEDGTRAEIVLNSLGVLNRMNPAQLIEQHINFMSDHVIKQIKAADDIADKVDIYMNYLKYLDKEQHDYFDEQIMMMSREQKEELMADIEEHGIFVHEPPFFNNTQFEAFKRIYREHPEWCTRYKCTFNDEDDPNGKPSVIEKPIVIGDIYFIRLKHEASNKTSYVSDDTTNNKNQPSKSNMKKNHKTLFQNTPVRLGEMEVDNLLLSKSGVAVERLLKSYSTSKEDRTELVENLLQSPNPFDTDVTIQEGKSINREILEKYLGVLELSLLDSSSDRVTTDPIIHIKDGK